MTQPELGNKVSSLRLAKGLTQTELAECCSLSLRTIQRIESAEVLPRAYTVRQIFEALGESNYFDPTPAKKSFKNWFSDINCSLHFTSKKMRIIVAFSILTGSLGLLFFGISDYFKTKSYSRNGAGLQEISFDMISRFNAGEIKEIGEIYLNTATLMPVNGEAIHGREKIMAYYQSVYDSGFRLVSDKINSLQITDSVATETGSWKGWNKQSFEGSYMAQWKKVNGKWYIENYMTNYSEEY